ncbi:MFS transporter [Kutzneria sp. CA-103260]|uniref:MFS transporter n=1 Tax=Kutzneria sp. CA-103260 TaxID=2802641 RepID=UPI001BA9EAD7|nr:MFS transporter [Kutzneria sp. CA-103260]
MLLWLARLISTAGTAVTAVALPVLMYSLTGSAVDTAALTALTAGPYALFGLLAGAVVDRMQRRVVMVCADLVSAALLASIPVASWCHWLTPAQLLIVAGACASVAVWFDAANFGALPSLVSRNDLVRANSAVWSAAMAVQIAAPAVAGVLIATVGAAGSVATDSLSFVSSALLVRAIIRPLNAARDTRQPLLADIREGLRFLWHQRTVRLFTALGLGQAISAGAVSSLLVVYAYQAFSITGDDDRLGLLFSAGGVGALAATVLLPPLARSIPPRAVTLLGLATGLGVLCALALAPVLWLALVALGLWGMASILVITNGITVRQLATPERLQGRVNVTGRMLSYGLGEPTGALAAGLLAEATTVRIALLICSIPMGGAVLLAWRARPSTDEHNVQLA